MLRICFSVFSIFLVLSAQGQVQAGTIIDPKAKPIQGASITILRGANESIVAFAFTDAQGRYTLSIPAIAQDSLKLRISHLGYAAQTFPLKQVPPTITLAVDSRPLPEVRVRNTGIYQRGDTVNYAMSEFAQKTDQVIGDVIRRLPGIEVKANGTIEYEGRPINRYYIEGLNLLDERYSLANNNLPAAAVASVQVIERHQPIRALDSVVPSQQAAINIKLKPGYKQRLLGRSKAAVGGAPLTADVELVPMKFGAANQMLATYKWNNAGIDYGQELERHNATDNIERMYAGFGADPYTTVPFPNPPAIGPHRVVFNRQHTLSFNNLQKSKGGGEWKWQVDGLREWERIRSGRQTTLYFPTDTVRIAEDHDFSRTETMLRAALIYTINTKNKYLVNTLRGQWLGREGQGITLARNDTVAQALDSRGRGLSNDLQWMSVQGKNILKAFSFVGVHTQPEWWQATPGPYAALLTSGLPYDRLRQPGAQTHLYTRNGVGYTRKGREWALGTALVGSFQRQSFEQTLFSGKGIADQKLADSFATRLRGVQYSIGLENSIGWKRNAWTIAGSLPISFYGFRTHTGGVRYRDYRLVAPPTFSVSYARGPFWIFGVDARQSIFFQDPTSFAPGYVLNDYRSFSRANPFLKQNITRNAGVTAAYRDAVKALFVNGRIGYSNRLSNALGDQTYIGQLLLIDQLQRRNPQPALQAGASVSKYFYRIKTGVNGSLHWSRTDSRQLRQGLQADFRNRVVGANAAVRNVWGPLSSEYALGMQWQRFGPTGKPLTGGLYLRTQQLQLNLSLPGDLFFGAKGEEAYYRGGDQPARSYWFVDCSLRKRLVKSKVDLEVSGVNLLNL